MLSTREWLGEAWVTPGTAALRLYDKSKSYRAWLLKSTVLLKNHILRPPANFMSIYSLLRHTRTLFKESSNRLSGDWYRHITVSFDLGKELCKHTQSLLKTNVTSAYLK